MDKGEFGIKLRNIRAKKGFSVEAGARKAGLSPTRLLGIEAGDIEPRIKTILKLLRGWAINPRELFNTEEL